MKHLILTAFLFSGCERYTDNDEYLPPVDKPIEVQVREMFEFINEPLIDYDKRTKTKSGN